MSITFWRLTAQTYRSPHNMALRRRYSSTLSLNSALYGVGGERNAPSALTPGKILCAYCIGGWVGPRAGLDGYGISRPHLYWIHGTCSPWRSRCNYYAIPIHSFGLLYVRLKIKFIPHGEQICGHCRRQSEFCLGEVTVTAFIVGGPR